jgi:NAD(P) transhydrogenase subunit alpha
VTLATSLAIFFLAGFVGFYVISRIPNTLHTPLMSVTNAIHGLVLLGAVIAIASVTNGFSLFLAIVAITFGTINIVGGFLVTDRMLQMFRVRARPEAQVARRSEDRDVIRIG